MNDKTRNDEADQGHIVEILKDEMEKAGREILTPATLSASCRAREREAEEIRAAWAATEGTKAVEPGISRRTVLCGRSGFRAASSRRMLSASAAGRRGISVEYTACSFRMPLCRHSLRMTRARGHTEV